MSELKTKYKYIHFEENGGEFYPLAIWICWNNNDNDMLGHVTYYPRWRQYVIEFERDGIFNNQCLNDIADFLQQLNKEKG